MLLPILFYVILEWRRLSRLRRLWFGTLLGLSSASSVVIAYMDMLEFLTDVGVIATTMM